MDRFLASYTDSVYRYRFFLLFLVPAISLSLAPYIDLTFNPSYRVFLGEDNPDLRAFDAYQAMFNKEDPANIIIDATRTGGVFTEKNLRLIRRLTERIRHAKDIPSFKRIMRVESITNYQHTSSDESGLRVKDLVGEEDLYETNESGDLLFDAYGNLIPKPLSGEFLQEAKGIALRESATRHRLISEDGNVTQIIVTFNIPDLSVIAEERKKAGLPRLDQWERRKISNLSLDITNALNDVVADIMDGSDLVIYKAGVLYMNRAFSTTIRDDFEHINPLVFGLIIVVTIFLFRSGWPILMIISVIAFSIIVSFGIAGLGEVSLSGPNGMTFQILMAVGVADTIHIVSTFYKSLAQGNDRRMAMRDSVSKNFLPCLITSVTTAIGFFSILLNEVPPVRSLGWITGIGVLYAFVVTILFVPVLLVLLPIGGASRMRVVAEKEKLGGYGRILVFSAKNRLAVAIGSIAFGILFSLFGFRLTAENDPTSYFKDSHEINVSINFSDSRFTGMYLIEYALNTGVEGGIKDPEFLRRVDEAKAWIEKQDGITHVFVLTDIVKRVNRLLNDDDPAYDKIPDSRAQVAEALFNYTASLPMGLDIQNQKSFDDAAIRLLVSAREMSAHEVNPLVDRITDYLNAHIPMTPTEVTGVRHLFNEMILRTTPEMMASSFLALGLITLALAIVFQSVRLGLFSILPNVLPITIVFGWRGLMGETIDLFSGLVACLALGIVVDDTVHLLTRFMGHHRSGMDPYTALKRSLEQCATPIILTSIILCFGFGIMLMSEFANNARLGAMTAAAIAIALWFDLLVVPAAILLFSKKESWLPALERDLAPGKA